MQVKKAFLIVSLILTLLVAVWALQVDREDAEELRQNQDLLDEVRGV